MFAHLRTRSAAIARQGTAFILGQLGAVVALCLGLLTACSSAPPSPFTGPDPSEPQARVARGGYRSTLRAYPSQRPVEPLPWREQNERVAPQSKP